MKVLVHGACGKMGAEVLKYIDATEGVTLFAGVDGMKRGETAFPCYASFDEVEGTPDVIVDFSFHTLVPSVMEYATRVGCAVVVATTGMDEAELASVREAAKTVPVFYSANMSVGIALLVDFAKRAAAAFPHADIEIVEAHHNRKVDAPSGTALMLAKGIQEVREHATLVTGRHGEGKRTPEEIGIHALRMANIVGEHEVLLTTDTQQLSLKHTAYDRGLFAEGAVKAACFVAGRAPGLYNMYDMLYSE